MFVIRGEWLVYTLTYSSIHESEVSLVGKRALFLAEASRKSLNTCLFFVVTGNSLREFFDVNSLQKKVFDLLNTGLPEDYFWSEVKNLFSGSVLPDSVLLDIKESYDALSVSVSDADNILRSFEPRVNLFLSSGSDCGFKEVFLNIKGFDNVVNALKSCWFLFFKKQGVESLRKGLFNFSCGVVVEKFVSSDFTVEVEGSSDEKHLLVSAYKGLPEVSVGIVKDLYVLSFNHLEFVNHELNHQNFSILHQDDSGVLLKKRLGKEGSDNKASKQVISDCARLAKRVFSLLNNFVRVVFVVRQGIPYLFLIDDFVSSDVADKVDDVGKSIISDNVGVLSDLGVSVPGGSFSDDLVESDALDVVEDDDLVDSSDVVNDADEFIVQDDQSVGVRSNNDFSSFFSLIELLEEDVVSLYRESFGFSPVSVEEAIFELDSKHGFGDKEKVLRALEVKSLLMNGEKVDDDIISSLIGVLEDFLKREG